MTPIFRHFRGYFDVSFGLTPVGEVFAVQQSVLAMKCILTPSKFKNDDKI